MIPHVSNASRVHKKALAILKNREPLFAVFHHEGEYNLTLMLSSNF